MAHAEKCPVCSGGGFLVNRHGGPVVDDCGQVKCHGCDGWGWVTVKTRERTLAQRYLSNTEDSPLPRCHVL